MRDQRIAVERTAAKLYTSAGAVRYDVQRIEPAEAFEYLCYLLDTVTMRIEYHNVDITPLLLAA